LRNNYTIDLNGATVIKVKLFITPKLMHLVDEYLISTQVHSLFRLNINVTKTVTLSGYELATNDGIFVVDLEVRMFDTLLRYYTVVAVHNNMISLRFHGVVYFVKAYIIGRYKFLWF